MTKTKTRWAVGGNMVVRSSANLAPASWLIAALLGTSACSVPVQLPGSFLSVSAQGVVGRELPAIPIVVPHSEPIAFISFTAAEREEHEKYREEFEKNRQQRIEGRKNSGKSFETYMTECVRGAFILAPVCIFTVPVVAMPVDAAIRHGTASLSEPYLPPLPSDQVVSRAEEFIRKWFTAASIAAGVSNVFKSRDGTANDSGFPRLAIRAQSAKFATNSAITITVVAQAEPVAGVFWPPTEHSYRFGYDGGNDEVLERAITEARFELARSILSTYPIRNGK